MTTTTVHPGVTTLRAIRSELNAQFLERADAIDAVLWGLLAGEHSFILGPPGTGKSAMARAVVARLSGCRYFEILLSKTRPAEAVLGAVDIPKLQASGDYHRRTRGTLLEADVAFIDEVGKMSPTLGHELLGALNERIRHEVNDAGSVHAIPLHGAVTASNEIPTSETDDAAALWDRLLIRVCVDYVQSTSAFVRLLDMVTPSTEVPAVPTTMAWSDLLDLAKLVPTVEFPVALKETMDRIRRELSGHKITASDRRWQQAARVIQAAAFMDGRMVATLDDLRVLDFILWSVPAQIDTVRRTRVDIADPMAKAALEIMDDIATIDAEVEARRHKALDQRAGYGVEASSKVKQLARKVTRLHKQYADAGRSTATTDELTTSLDTLQAKIGTVCLDMGDVDSL